MYLEGEKFYWHENKVEEDGFPVQAKILDIAYWRKHPNLHGYIVQNFANGVDECQRIHLDKNDLEKIIDAIKNDELPETTGFFFGEPQDPNDQNSINQIQKAIDWLKVKEPGVSKKIIYQASW